MMDHALYFGEVVHKRTSPIRHRLRYRVFSLYVDLDRLGAVIKSLRLLSYNRFNLVSFHDRDHGPRDGSPLRPWVEAALARVGIDLDGGPVRLLCFPRILGFVFNPLSVYFCYDREARLRAVLYEVKNTFGDQHGYLLEVPEARQSTDAIDQTCAKTFYVSPFIEMGCRYHFRLHEPEDRLALAIRQTGDAGTSMVATQTGRRRALTDRNLIAAFLRYPLMTVKVVAGIHWEALFIWLKGAPFRHRPQPPGEEVSTPGRSV